MSGKSGEGKLARVCSIDVTKHSWSSKFLLSFPAFTPTYVLSKKWQENFLKATYRLSAEDASGIDRIYNVSDTRVHLSHSAHSPYPTDKYLSPPRLCNRMCTRPNMSLGCPQKVSSSGRALRRHSTLLRAQFGITVRCSGKSYFLCLSTSTSHVFVRENVCWRPLKFASIPPLISPSTRSLRDFWQRPFLFQFSRDLSFGEGSSGRRRRKKKVKSLLFSRYSWHNSHLGLTSELLWILTVNWSTFCISFINKLLINDSLSHFQTWQMNLHLYIHIFFNSRLTAY